VKPPQMKFDMSLSVPRKRRWLLGLLALSLIASVWIDHDADQPSTKDELLTKPAPLKISNSSISSSHWQRTLKLQSDRTLSDASTNDGFTAQPLQIASRSYSPVTQNMFSSQTWEPPQPKFKKESRPVVAPLMAPPIPFTYLGKIEEDGKIEYFVLHQNKLFNLKVGQLVQGQWRLDSEDAKHLNWTFLPLKLPQTLPKTTNQRDLALMKDVVAVPEQ